jgi:CubicO group peptidase (beta-lactamase class C family)
MGWANGFWRFLFGNNNSEYPENGLEGLTTLVREAKVPGLAVTVLHNGEVVLNQGLGYAHLDNKTPIDTQNTLFRIASVSKPITGLALAQMVRDGLLDWDDSVYEYVPDFPRKTHDISIRQLASHTAGIRGYKGMEYGLNRPMTLTEGINLFKDDPLLFEPGTDYLYNSFDFCLLSLAMQNVCGMPFSEYVNQKVLLPLGLEKIQAEIKNELPENTAHFYTRFKSGFMSAIPVDNGYKLAGGGYLSSSWEVAQLGQALLDGRIPQDSITEEMLRAQTVQGRSVYYGMGWQVSSDAQGRPYVGHVGNGVGGYSVFYVYPEQQMVFSILINCTNPRVEGAIDGFLATMLDMKAL